MIDLNCLSTNLPEDILRLEAYGDFDYALRLIEMRLNSNIPVGLRERLEYEKIRIDRLRKEYTYTFDEALSLAQEKIHDFTRDELCRLKDEGYADWIFINGSVVFNRSFLRNIIKTRPEIADRSVKSDTAFDDQKKDKILEDTIDEIMEKGQKSCCIHIKAGVRLKKEAVKKDETVRVFVPVPHICQQVKNIKIINSQPEIKYMAPENYPQRTGYFEKKACGEDEFLLEYSYENHVQYKKFDFNEVPKLQPDFDTEELSPHIVFTPYLKKLAYEITGSETNALKKARKIYDFITMNVKYSFVREYSTIENIPEYAACNLKGDCGVQALLFITLCRICGIPAGWQSGLYVNPYFIGCHDWAQFYIEPYGWLFADPSFGGSGYRKGNLKKWNFYFGNIDPFRMPANSRFQHDFTPGFNFFRSDPYDNQRGEVECTDRGIYNDGFETIMDVIEIHDI